MASVVNTFSISGIEGYCVQAEANTLEGQPSLTIIGMGDQAVKESGERVQSALDACGYEFPKKRVIINLAPGDKKKSGSHFDLPMAMGLLLQTDSIQAKDINQYGFIGELSLNADLRPVPGILPMVMAAKAAGLKKIVVPARNAEEARLVKGIEIYGLDNLRQAVEVVEGKASAGIVRPGLSGKPAETTMDELDFADVKGQEEVINAIVLAAAGGHNILMIGTPGCGKTMIAQRIPSILPKMSEEEQLEVTKIHSIAGLLEKDGSLITSHPFRAPHHNVSLNALIGGGVNAMPGEVSLAHNGVLFLDELTEYSKHTLDALRQPIEDKKVTIARVNGTHTFPSNFMLVAAMNPCPCGYYPDRRCRCTDYEIIKYRSKISGPIMDRIDIQKEVKPVGYFDIGSQDRSRSSAQLRERVRYAREIQQRRYKGIPGVNCNAQMTNELIRQYCELDDSSVKILKETCERYGYSARVIHKLLKVARTAADLDGAEKIRLQDIETAIGCRDLDRSSGNMLAIRE